MKLIAAVLACLWSTVAFSQGVCSTAGVGVQSASAPLSFNKSTHVIGPKFPAFSDTANTTCHLWFSNGAVQDTKGCSWSVVGSPTISTTTPAYASGFASNANITGPSTLRTLATGSYSCCIAMSHTYNASVQGILGATDNASAGWYLEDREGAVEAVQLMFPAASKNVNGGGAGGMRVKNGRNVACWGVNGTTGYIMENQGPMQSVTTIGTVAASTAAFTVGYVPGVAVAFQGSVFELWCSSDAAIEGIFRWQMALGMNAYMTQ